MLSCLIFLLDTCFTLDIFLFLLLDRHLQISVVLTVSCVLNK